MGTYSNDEKCKCGNSFGLHRAGDGACPLVAGGWMERFKFELQVPFIAELSAALSLQTAGNHEQRFIKTPPFDSSKYMCTECGATHGEACPNSGQHCNYGPKKVKPRLYPDNPNLDRAGERAHYAAMDAMDEPIQLDRLVPPAPASLPTTAAERKAIPIYSGFVKYFPLAIAAVAELSRKGNDQHNPGKPLHWDRNKSGDEMDAQMRHIVDTAIMGDDAPDTDDVLHATKNAWRAMANLQKILERK